MIDHVRSSEDICIARDLVRKSLAGANPRHLKAFLLYQMGFTLGEIGAILSLSRARVGQIKHRVLVRAEENASRDESLRRYPTS